MEMLTNKVLVLVGEDEEDRNMRMNVSDREEKNIIKYHRHHYRYW